MLRNIVDRAKTKAVKAEILHGSVSRDDEPQGITEARIHEAIDDEYEQNRSTINRSRAMAQNQRAGVGVSSVWSRRQGLGGMECVRNVPLAYVVRGAE